MAEEPPGPAPDAEPRPLEVPLEEQIGALPPLQYPGGSREQEFAAWAAAKRRRRIRLEVIGAVLILVGAVVTSIVTGRTGLVILGVFGVAALAAYEFLVASFE